MCLLRGYISPCFFEYLGSYTNCPQLTKLSLLRATLSFLKRTGGHASVTDVVVVVCVGGGDGEYPVRVPTSPTKGAMQGTLVLWVADHREVLEVLHQSGQWEVHASSARALEYLTAGQFIKSGKFEVRHPTSFTGGYRFNATAATAPTTYVDVLTHRARKLPGLAYCHTYRETL